MRIFILFLSSFLAIQSMALTITVNDLGDAPDRKPGDGACLTASGKCTLRAAIMEANAHTDIDVIKFSVSGTIRPATNLPSITEDIVITGDTAPGYVDHPVVIVDGRGVLTSGFEFSHGANNSKFQAMAVGGINGAALTVRSERVHVVACWLGSVSGAGPNITGILLACESSEAAIGSGRFPNVISGNRESGIEVCGSLHSISNSRIGTDPSGRSAVPNRQGIAVNGATDIKIGNDDKENVISGNLVGIAIADAARVSIDSSMIGTDIDGQAAIPNYEGISVDRSSNNQIGSPSRRTVISGNTAYGVVVGPESSQTTIGGNLIGTDRSGARAIPNQVGILISGPDNAVGTPNAGNVISGNQLCGILIDRNGVRTTVRSNLIGLDVLGQIAIPNNVGIEVQAADAPLNVVIGGTDRSSRNAIVAVDSGIKIRPSEQVKVIGNFIGTNSRGEFAASTKTQYGIYVEGGGDLTLGANDAPPNVISNTQNAIWLARGTTKPCLIANNYIGTDVTATKTIGNGVGIELHSGGHQIQNNIIAGSTSYGVGLFADNNRVARNAIFGNAIGIWAETGTGNTFGENQIKGSQKLGIDLAPDGVTLNDDKDPDPGPNLLQNFPVITSVRTAGSKTVINGTLNSVPSTAFTIHLYSNVAAHSTGYGEGETYLGLVMVTTDANGNASFQTTMPQVSDGAFITGTATGPWGTSEFSRAFSTKKAR